MLRLKVHLKKDEEKNVGHIIATHIMEETQNQLTVVWCMAVVVWHDGNIRHHKIHELLAFQNQFDEKE